jgi:hypothetical protein
VARPTQSPAAVCTLAFCRWHPQQLRRLDLQHRGELGDDFQVLSRRCSSLYSPSPLGQVSGQAFNLASGQFKVGYAQVIGGDADTREHAIPSRLRRRLSFGQEQIVGGRGENLAYSDQRR